MKNDVFLNPFATIIRLLWFCWNFSSNVRWLLILIADRWAIRGWTKKWPTCSQSNQCKHTFYLSHIFYSVTEISSTGLASNGILLIDFKTVNKTQHLELPCLKIEQQLMAYVTISILPSTSYKPQDREELLTVLFRTRHLSFFLSYHGKQFQLIDKGYYI